MRPEYRTSIILRLAFKVTIDLFSQILHYRKTLTLVIPTTLANALCTLHFYPFVHAIPAL